MAALAETRDVGSLLPLPATVRRLCCIGDSITYGQGVAPHQTLAMHIARFANMAYPDEIVWVDNRGLSSGNIWHSWVAFARLLETTRYDAAIFSICNNDSHIFESNSVRYDGDPGPTWLDAGRLKPLLSRSLAEIAKGAASRNLCLILDFFTIWERDAPIVEAVGKECAAIGLPFVDLLDFFSKESPLSAAEYSASPFDGHPSNSGHYAAARRIVDELRRQWQPTSNGTAGIGQRLLEACDQAVDSGWSPDDIAHWAMLVLDAKETAARRRGKEGADRLGDLARTRAAIQDRYLSWYADRAEAAQRSLLHIRRDDFAIILERADASLRNLDEMAFVVEHLCEGGPAGELWALIEAAGYYKEQGRLLELPAKLKAQLLAMAEMTSLQPSAHLPPVLLQFAWLRSDFSRSLRRLAGLLPDKLQSTTFDDDVRGLWQVAHYLVKGTWSYVEQFERTLDDATVGVPQQPVFFTSVDVWVERRPDRPRRGGMFNLTVEFDYIEPRRAQQRCKAWGSADEDLYVYHFEMPLMLLGVVGIGVPSWDDLHQRFVDQELRISKLRISNRPSQKEGGRAFEWQPGPDSSATHWLKFDALAVPPAD
jgi:lysophospholipase L1-like esterase